MDRLHARRRDRGRMAARGEQTRDDGAVSALGGQMQRRVRAKARDRIDLRFRGEERRDRVEVAIAALSCHQPGLR